MQRSSFFIPALVLALTLGATAPTPDPLQTSAFLIGSWHCTYSGGGQTMGYDTTFSWAPGNNWIHERDAIPGAGVADSYLTFDPSKHQWTYAVLGTDRSTTLFVGNAANASHIVYRSIFPDASETDVFDTVSPAKFTLHFTQTTGGKTVKSSDVCVKR